MSRDLKLRARFNLTERRGSWWKYARATAPDRQDSGGVMKPLSALLLLLAIVQSAYAAPAKPKPPADHNTDSRSAVQAYKAMSVAERIGIETDLIWTGDYNGVTDGDFGDRAVSAVKAFQQRTGGRPTGVLNPQERGQLSASARTRQEAVGWRIIQDPVTGARVGIPTKLVRPSTQGETGIRYASGRGEIQIETFRVQNEGHAMLQQVLDEQRRDPARRIEYSVVKPDFLVTSGLQGGVKKFYTRAAIKDGEVRGMTVLYDLANEGTMERVVVAMSSAFAPFQGGAAAEKAVHKLVQYSTGIIIDDAGHVLTERQAIEGCFAIAIVGFGHADVAAQDQITGLALLQIYGARKLRPIPLAAGTSAAAEVTVVGIADPQVQDGGSAVSTVRARLGAVGGSTRILEPAPAAGFSGAAVLQGDGALAGMVELATADATTAESAQPAVVVPSEVIRGFLERAHVALAATLPAGAADTAGVVRVICSRK